MARQDNSAFKTPGRAWSHKSNRSASSRPSESREEKEARRLKTYADPTLAISEAEPTSVAMEKANIESLRSIHHRDMYGNPIVDPDLSNPTRPRLERPLDTIRAFEAAIDGSYASRHLSSRPDRPRPSQSDQVRSSYYNAQNPATNYSVTGPPGAVPGANGTIASARPGGPAAPVPPPTRAPPRRDPETGMAGRGPAKKEKKSWWRFGRK